MRITIEQISKRAGVAKSTVSLVLSGKARKARISEAMIEHVSRAARELDFRPNSAARATVTGRFNCALLLLSTDRLVSNMPSQMVDGIHDALMAHGMHLAIAKLPDDKLTQPAYMPKFLSEQMADGLLINYHFGIPPDMERLIREDTIPSVWINSKREADCIYPDDFEAGLRATQLLLRAGHRKIAYADYSHGKDDQTVHYSAQDRRAGYEQAMQQAALPVRVIQELEHVQSGRRMDHARRWLAGDDRPTAIVSYADRTAGPICAAALSLGIQVPQELSMVTMSDVPFGTAGPLMTTMLVPQRELGHQAAEMLLEKLKHPDRALPCRRVRFDMETGNTVSAPPRGA
jgi:LacI family transcriptional regulator